MVASFDRPEQDARSLPGLVAEASASRVTRRHSTNDDQQTKDLIDGIVKDSIDRFVKAARTRRAHA